MRRATSLSEALQGWVSTLSLSKIRIQVPRVYPSNERETSCSNETIYGKTTNNVYMYMCVNKQQSSINVLSTGWWEAARARHEGECIGGCLLDEGAESADCRKTKVRSGL